MSWIDNRKFSCWLEGCRLETNSDEKTLVNMVRKCSVGQRNAIRGIKGNVGAVTGMESRRVWLHYTSKMKAGKQ